MLYNTHSDGACSGNPGPGGYGVVVVSPQGKETPFNGFEPETTNQRMELMGAIIALENVPSGHEATLTSDSQYVVKGMNDWRFGWIKRGWKNSKKEPISNRELWERLITAHNRLKSVKYSWVKGHSGDHYNDMCDALARSAIVKGVKEINSMQTFEDIQKDAEQIDI